LAFLISLEKMAFCKLPIKAFIDSRIKSFHCMRKENMNFELSEEQIDIQKAAMEFAQGEFDPDVALDLDRTGQFPESIWKKACRLGYIGIHYPEALGGQGLGLFENLLVIEAFCRVDSGIGSALSAVDLGSEIILKFGSPEQKKRFLLPLARGEKKLTIAFAESEDGNDLSYVSSTAERTGTEYHIEGKKEFVLNAPFANGFVTLCKEPTRGWITLMIEREKEGIEVHPVEKMGLRMIPFGSLLFKGVHVPLENCVGREGDGMEHVQHCYQAVGLRRCGQAMGAARGALDRAMQHAKQREQFGRKLSQFQALRHKMADMAASIEVIRWLTCKAAADYDRGKADPGFLATTRLEAGRRLAGVVDEAVQIFGGYGYMAEQPIEHYFRDAWAIEADLGTEEEQKDRIADRLLGPNSTRK
jgi:alkylation response protein AidB-like acyl-CoA dehydrogenase